MSLTTSVELQPQSIEQLLASCDWDPELRRGELLEFRTPEGYDVYNITAPFEYEGESLILGRTEHRTDELGTITRFFRQRRDEWVHDESLPSLPLQDPFTTTISGQRIVGGVKVYPSNDNPNEVGCWETHLYMGDDLDELNLVCVGPPGMKDIRVVELEEGVGVFTRPQGEKGGLGKIGFVRVPRVEDITPQLLQDAPVIPGLFVDGEWGGVNAAHLAPDGFINVAGHIARRGDGLEYYPIAFIFDPLTFAVSSLQIVATRNCFPDTESKKPSTKRVLFSGDIAALGQLADWYGGVSDARGGKLTGIPNPYSIRPSSLVA